MKFLSALLCCLVPLSLWAQEPTPSPANKGLLEPFRPNYLLFWSQTNYETLTRQAEESQFQLSFRKEIIEMKGWRLVGAYTQNSFWQLFNLENSRPFRETNYAPQLFIQTPHLMEGFPLELEAGYIHQSNGGQEPLSRSWDRIFLGVYGQGDAWDFNHRFWHRLSEDKKEFEGDPRGDENPDIEDFYGIQEGYYRFYFWGLSLNLKERWNFTTKQGSLTSYVTGPLFSSSLYWQIYHFQGYGESLADYNRSLRKWGLGVVFSQIHKPQG